MSASPIAKERLRRPVWALADLAARPSARFRALPDYLILGAQRSGTTSLQRALTAHPNVLPPRLRKGIHYFDTDLHRGDAWYLSQFPLAAHRRRVQRSTGGPVVTGEASPYYLFHPLVPVHIARLLPGVRMIALLRDPVERAISHHKHEVRRGFEDLSLAEALDREEERLAGEVERMEADPGYQSFSLQHHSYLARGRYAPQVERYRSVLPPENLLVLEAESFWEHPAATFRRVVSFLGLPGWEPVEFPHMNATRPAEVADETRSGLLEAFRPSNARLAALLGEAFRWM